ncbi:MAG: glycerol kinase GlpK [Clostridia bacterium]|nr:glycerol kinase GlpK [Clostridia bacterium]
MSKYIMAIDAGTTSNRCIIFDKEGNIIASAQKEFAQIYPSPGWVEHDPLEIWESVKSVMQEAQKSCGCTSADIAAIGITNQRETVVVWDKTTGKPVYNAIVWQCRRTSAYCDKLKARGLSQLIQDKTGLVIDPYYSATKLRWILRKVPEAQTLLSEGKLVAGTIDTWLIWKLSGGKTFVTDVSNASRTMLYNIHELCWDKELMELLEVPEGILPEVKPSSCMYGCTDPEITGSAIPISGAAGDQQAALFGQACFSPGDAKNTYGTGSFMLMNTGKTPVVSKNGLLTTIAWMVDGEVKYALEGSVFVAGAVVQWLRDEMGLIKSSAQTEEYAQRVTDTHGCYVVPAFTGLGSPHWDQYARGTIVGLTRGCNKYHIVRAALDSIAYQVSDILNAMYEDSGIKLSSLKVDGGASANNYLMQTQADLINVPVQRPACVESTAIGAAYLAGLAVGYWKDKQEIIQNRKISRTFIPRITETERTGRLKGWNKAVTCALNWAKDE